jgi:hypothetical protein
LEAQIAKGGHGFSLRSNPDTGVYIGEIKDKDGKFVSATGRYSGGCPTQIAPS